MASFSEYGETFCVFPWVHAMTRPHGTMQPCCTSTVELKRDSGTPYYLWESSIADVWNSAHYREIRRQMLAGGKVAGCDWCYNLEKVKKRSYRQTSNDWWERQNPNLIHARVEQSRARDFFVEGDPVSLDLRLGNLCNLRCRSCHPTSSSQLAEEWKGFIEKYPEFCNIWSGKFFDQPGGTPRDEIPAWYKAESFWQEIFRFLPEVKSIYITGGEPTLLRGNYILLEKCVEAGYARDIELMLNTNLTTESAKFMGFLPHFKKVQLNCSIDAYGKQNEYLRYPSSWETTDRNMRAMLPLPANVNISVNPVVQFHNVLNLDVLLEYIEELNRERATGKVFIETIILQMNPKWLEMGLLPQTVRELAAARLRRFIAGSFLYREDAWSRMNLDSVLRVLEEAPDSADREILQLNKRYTEIHDDARSVRFRDYFPELHGLLVEAGVY